MDEVRLRLETFFERYSAEVAANGRALLDRLEARIPGATIMVYDNYNALAIGFAAEDRADAVVLPIDPAARGSLVIKSVSDKQRPRRPRG